MKKIFYLCSIALTILTSCSDVDRADNLFNENRFEEAAELYQKAAEDGDGYAMWKLSGMYNSGRGVQYNQKKALELLRKSANAGCEEAICDSLLAHIWGWYHFKTEPQSTFDKFVKFAKSTDNSYVQACYASVYYNGIDDVLEKDKDKAEEILEKVKDKSNDRYRVMMGLIYCNGTTKTEIDENKAIEYWEKSYYYSKIASLYLFGGSLVEKDINKAIEYYKKGVEREHSASMVSLAKIYSSSDSIYKEYHDIKTARQLISNAIHHGDGDACDMLGCWYALGENDFAIDEEKAFEYFNKAYEYCSDNGALNAGVIYYTGRGCKQNIPKAIECFTYAAEHGSGEAALNLWDLYINGTIKEGANKDVINVDKAVIYLKKAAKLNNARACLILGLNYSDESSFCGKDDQQAFAYLKKAADLGSYEACEYVSYMYKEGQGCTQDLKLSKEYEKKAKGSD